MFMSEAEWDPHSENFMCNELALSLTDMLQDRTIYVLDTRAQVTSQDETDLVLSQVSSVYSDYDFNIKLNFSSIHTHEHHIMSQGMSAHQFQVAKEELSKLWGISVENAAQTLRVTTQKGIRNAIHPVVRRFATKQSRLRYNQLGSRHGPFYSDTFFSSVPSTRGNTMAQLFVNDVKYLRIMPMRKNG
jgi:hypothetical protein